MKLFISTISLLTGEKGSMTYGVESFMSIVALNGLLSSSTIISSLAVGLPRLIIGRNFFFEPKVLGGGFNERPFSSS